MKRTAQVIVLSLTAMAAGCALHLDAELLNPLNKSGRVESSAPQDPQPLPTPPPAATPTPTPSPTPGGAK